ncbi:MAG: biotin--[acetyl-CoA-carboxylase] ligase [Microlunatus sp.]|nr:biotin--[acetyl-CoA-carboxylase] ligase [Microlunatus sp.]
MYDTDPIDAKRLTDLLLGPGSLWSQLEVVSETGSTNADLAGLASSGRAGHGAVLLTTFQSRGRGRLDRSWSAPPGASLAMSVLVVPGDRPDADGRRHWTWLPLICGMATSEGIRRATGVPAVLKWPNDVMVGDRKLCGILAEQVDTPAGPGCVIGIGINTDLTEDELPVPWATSLLLAGATTRNKTTIAATVLRAFALLYENWHDHFDATALAEAYVARCATIGREVRVVLSEQESATGRAVAIDGDGRLVVRTEQGRRVFGAGDIVHLR